MKKSYLVTAVAGLLALCTAAGAFAVEPYAIRESTNGDPGSAGTPCVLAGNTDGTAGNYRWYNVCSGYIWIFSAWVANEGVGVLYGGAGNEAVAPTNSVKRTITYFRNIVANYNQTVDVFVDASTSAGCVGANIASDLDLDPGLRWNCSEFNVCIPGDYVVVRQQHDGGAAPTFATDGPFANACDPTPPQRSYYYGINGSACLAWPGQTDAADNWLQWLIIDGNTCGNATESKSWGNIKGLYR